MVPSLRSLCLKRVIALNLSVDRPSLPIELFQDLMKVKLFNGSFSCYIDNPSSHDIHLTCLTIQYDGASWLFKSRCISFPNFCCFNCSVAAYLPDADPELHQFSLAEGEIVDFDSPFSEVRSWRENLISSEFPIKMSVAIDYELGTFGILRFHGSSEGVAFASNFRVEVAMDGSRHRVMFCGAHVVTDPIQQEIFFVKLNGNEVPAEEALAFSNIDTMQHCQMVLDELFYYSQDLEDVLFGIDYRVWDEEDVNNNSSEDPTEGWCQGDCLVEFWQMINLNAGTADNDESESNL